MDMQTRVGLAFQGGGFPAGAIGAGVVKRLKEEGVFQKTSKFDMAVFSGTSSGSLNAAVCWGHKLRGTMKEAPDTLEKLWLHFALGLVPDTRTAQMAQLIDSLARMNPVYEFYSENMVVPLLRHLMKEWILTYIPVEELIRLRDQTKEVPGLALGAADVLRGEIKVFRERDFSLEAILASGSLDEVNGLTEIKGGPSEGVYCDGAWGTNPPLNEMIDYGVDELWLVEVFPKKRGQIPRTPAARPGDRSGLCQFALFYPRDDGLRPKICRYLFSGLDYLP